MNDLPTILIRCVQRPETNAYFTIANMACADPEMFARIDRVHLMSGDNKIDFLASLQKMNRVIVHHKPVDVIASWKPKRKGAWSYSFAMHTANMYKRDCVVMEDDITFANGWLTRLLATVSKIRSCTPKPFLLSAYHRKALTSAQGFEAVPKYDPNMGSTHFWGNLCTFWSKELIPAFLPFFDGIIKASQDMSTDLSVQSYASHVGAPFFVTAPSLVQHMGDKTTLRPDGIRRSPMFETFYDEKA